MNIVRGGMPMSKARAPAGRMFGTMMPTAQSRNVGLGHSRLLARLSGTLKPKYDTRTTEHYPLKLHIVPSVDFHVRKRTGS